MPISREESSRFAQVGDLRIHYHDAGSGDPIFFLHGAGPGAGGWSNFSRNVDFFAQKYRVILPDHPGWAESDKPRAVNEGFAGFHARNLRDLMDVLGIEKARIVGNSLGGVISQKFAMDYPDRLISQVLMGSPSFMPLMSVHPAEGQKQIVNYYEGEGPTIDKMRAFLKNMVYDASALTEELVQDRFKVSMHPDLIANPPMTASKPLQLEPLWKDLDKIPHKTLVIWGRDDITVPMDHMFIQLKTLPDVQVHVFSKCAHWVQWEKADEFNRLTMMFFEHDS